MKSPSLLSVKNLNVTISNSTILKKISFELQKNEILGVVGESGSGKSITAFSIINLFSSKKLQQKGEIFFNGDRIDSMSSLIVFLTLLVFKILTSSLIKP